MVDQAPSSERRCRFVPTFYESWKADGRVGNTVKMQKLMRASCDKVPTLTPYGQSTVERALALTGRGLNGVLDRKANGTSEVCEPRMR